jgi:nitrogen fixation protein FixH
MRSTLAVALLFFLGVCLVGCLERPQAPNWKLELRVVPDPPRPLEESTFAVRLRSVTDEAVTGARVEADLSMPSHRMGENRVALRETEAGIYTGTGRFTMPGEWRVEIRVEKGDHRRVEQFHFAVR